MYIKHFKYKKSEKIYNIIITRHIHNLKFKTCVYNEIFLKDDKILIYYNDRKPYSNKISYFSLQNYTPKHKYIYIFII